MPVVELPIGTPPAQQGIIAILEQALERARNGDIIAIAIATVDQGRLLGRHFDDGGDWARLLASVVAMQHDLLTTPNEG